MKIFVIDDDELILEVITLILQRGGHEVTAFNRPQVLFDALAADDLPEIVLADMFMPDFTGLDVIDHVKQVSPEIPVIIMTGARDFNTTVAAINKGAYGYLLKPLVTEELQSMVERVCTEENLRKKLAEEQEKFSQAERLAEIGMLAAGVAHEINNPNCFIRGNAELIRKIWDRLKPVLESQRKENQTEFLEYAKEEINSILSGIISGSDRISRIVRTLMLYSKQTPDQILQTDIRQGIEKARQILAEELKDLTVEMEDRVPALRIVHAGEVQWVQILFTLLSFAVSSLNQTRREDRKISIRLKQTDEHTLHMEISDNGQGIDPRLAGERDDPFQAMVQPGRESGLSLFIAEKLLARLDGSLNLSNNPDGGTTYSVTLPAAIN